MKVGVVANPLYSDLPAVFDRAIAAAKKFPIEFCVERDLDGIWPGECIGDIDARNDLDLLLTFGGDGTFLRGVRHLREHQVPVLGVNLGKVGFLTTAQPEDLDEAFGAFVEGNYATDMRHRIDGFYARDSAEERFGDTALNDIVLHHGRISRVINMSVRVNGEEVGQYSADGMIISTPTGSTAYALAAGGPIITPDVDALTITPVAAHTLAVRPLVVPGDAIVTVEVVMIHAEGVLVSYDGRKGGELGQGERLVVRRSQHPVKLIQFPGMGFFERMRRKLQWGDLSDRLPR